MHFCPFSPHASSGLGWKITGSSRSTAGCSTRIPVAIKRCCLEQPWSVCRDMGGTGVPKRMSVMAAQGQAPPRQHPAGPVLPSSRRRAVVQGLYFGDTQCSGSLDTESRGDKRIPWTSLGPGVPGQPHRGLLQPLLAALPALPSPACPPPPVPILYPVSQTGRAAHPKRRAPPTSPKPPGRPKRPPALPRTPQPGLCLCKVSFGPMLAPARAGHRGHLPTPWGDAAQQTRAVWPCPDPAYAAPAPTPSP